MSSKLINGTDKVVFGCLNRELDPHGAYGTGNPIGGNVTSNITGDDENFAEWMVSLSSIS